jgi:ornithine carbamoyltransferase
MMQAFLDIADYDTATLTQIIRDGMAMKANPDDHLSRLAGKSIALIFEKPSTRTRVSFEVGVYQLGASPVVLDSKSMQLGRGETIADTARALSRYVDAIMIRANSHAALVELAKHAEIPVINGLTDRSHPCQVMADVMTLAEYKAPDLDFSHLSVLWTGDGNNVAHSWIEASARFGFALTLATPASMRPDEGIVTNALKEGGRITLADDAFAAAKGVDLIVTDTWASMGSTADVDKSAHDDILTPFRVTSTLMKQAASDAIFMHCLPVYRGNEVVTEVVDGPQSVIWDEAENRLHVQKAIMCHCMDIGVGQDRGVSR